MLGALIVTTLLDGIGFGQRPLACSFPPPEPVQTPITLTVIDRPSLKDLPGLYRAEMDVNDKISLMATAQPLTAQGTRGAIVRAKVNETTYYVLGFDETGRAALNVTWDETPPRQMTRTGQCRNYERYIRRWSTS